MLGLLRAGLRAWIGLVEALALDWIDHRDLGREALVGLATRAFGLVRPDAGRPPARRMLSPSRGRKAGA